MTLLDHSEPECNGNEGVLHTPHNFKSGASPSDAVYCDTQDTSSTWPIDRTLTGITTLDQSGIESNSNKGVLHMPHSYRTGASPSDAVEYHTQDTPYRRKGVLQIYERKVNLIWHILPFPKLTNTETYSSYISFNLLFSEKWPNLKREQ